LGGASLGKKHAKAPGQSSGSGSRLPRTRPKLRSAILHQSRSCPVVAENAVREVDEEMPTQVQKVEGQIMRPCSASRPNRESQHSYRLRRGAPQGLRKGHLGYNHVHEAYGGGSRAFHYAAQSTHFADLGNSGS
jgi:hypothetical protein